MITDEQSFRAAAAAATHSPRIAMGEGLIDALEPAVLSLIRCCWVRGLDDEAAVLHQLADRARTRAAHALVRREEEARDAG